MPVVAAAGFEGDVGERYLRIGDPGEVAVAGEVAGVGRVRFADGEDRLLLEPLLVRCRPVVGPHLLCHAESGPGVGPSGIEGGLREQGGDLRAGDAVAAAHLQVGAERVVDEPLAEQNRDGNQAAVVEIERGVVPDGFAEENVVVELREPGNEFAENGVPGGLSDRILCHSD